MNENLNSTSKKAHKLKVLVTSDATSLNRSLAKSLNQAVLANVSFRVTLRER